jgi:hypothetical protein
MHIMLNSINCEAVAEALLREAGKWNPEPDPLNPFGTE